MKKLDKDTVRIIKIGKQALFEFIYENFIDGQEEFLDVDCLSIEDSFDIDWEEGKFIFCAYKSENSMGLDAKFFDEIDLQKLMKKIPDTTETMYAPGRYREYTKEELIELSK